MAEHESGQCHLFRLFFEYSPDPMFIETIDGKILDCNVSALKMLGYTKHEMLSLNVEDLIPKDKRKILPEIMKKIIHVGSAVLESENIKKDGSVVQVEAHLKLIHQEGRPLIFAVVVNIGHHKKIEKDLKDSEEKYRTLFLHQDAILASIPDIIMEVDKNKVYTWANKKGFEFFGADVLGKRASHYFIGKQATYKIVEPLFVGTKDAIYVESWQRRKDGEKRLLAWWSRSLKDDQGNIIGAISTARDVTDYRLMEEKLIENKKRDEIVFSSIVDTIFVCDKKGKILNFNKAAENLTGISAKEAIGSHYHRVFSFVEEVSNKPSYDFIVEAIEKEKIIKNINHMMLVLKDGRKISISGSTAPIKNTKEGTVGCVVTLRDITKERAVDKTKSEFVSVASHQLRTPLTGIKWFVELLLKNKLSPTVKDYIDQIAISNERMIRLVDDLLSVSHIETGRRFNVVANVVDVVPVLRQIMDEQRLLAKLKKVELVCSKTAPLELILKVDVEKIRIIFQNLISNAVKYSKKGGKVEVGCEQQDKQVVFYVRDFGFGIPDSDKHRIFEKFFRGENALLANTDGTGLGLFIVKAAVEDHGGEIWFESQKNKGSTFYFSLPTVNKKN